MSYASHKVLVVEYDICDPWRGLWTLPFGLETLYRVQILLISHPGTDLINVDFKNF